MKQPSLSTIAIKKSRNRYALRGNPATISDRYDSNLLIKGERESAPFFCAFWCVYSWWPDVVYISLTHLRIAS